MDTDRRGSVLGCGQAPGLRKLTPQMLGTIEVAETHKFTSEMQPGQVLAAFKAAAPYLGLRPSVVHAIDWLFRFTDPLDWQPSSRPIVWPSAAMQQQELGLGPSQVKNLNRHLVELGLVVMRDSPNGKRYGRRDPQGRIVEAYGFDLSPLASRCRVPGGGRGGRGRTRTRTGPDGAAPRSPATAIRQLLETADEQRIAGGEWEAPGGCLDGVAWTSPAWAIPARWRWPLRGSSGSRATCADYLEAALEAVAARTNHAAHL